MTMLLVMLLAIASALAGCHREAARGSACMPGSPWLALTRAPPTTAAMGVLWDPQLGSAQGVAETLHVRWASGGSALVPVGEISWSPEGELLPTLGPLHLPAVFAADDDNVLLWARSRWACASRVRDRHDLLRSMKTVLWDAIADQEKRVRSATNSSGYTLHDQLVVTLEPQPIRQNPDASSAPITGRAIRPSYPCSNVNITLRGRTVPTPTELEQAPTVPGQCLSAVRIAQRSNDGTWAEVILPREDAPIYKPEGALVIHWDSKPAGWVQIETAGPVRGSRLIKWHVERWGPWP